MVDQVDEDGVEVHPFVILIVLNPKILFNLLDFMKDSVDIAFAALLIFFAEFGVMMLLSTVGRAGS